MAPITYDTPVTPDSVTFSTGQQVKHYSNGFSVTYSAPTYVVTVSVAPYIPPAIKPANPTSTWGWIKEAHGRKPIEMKQQNVVHTAFRNQHKASLTARQKRRNYLMSLK